MIFMRKLSALTSLLLLAAIAHAQAGTMTPAGLLQIQGGATTVMTGAGTVTSSSFVTFTTNTLMKPTLPANTARKGTCDLIWQGSATTGVTPTFALNTSATLTSLQIMGSTNHSSTSAVVNFLPPTTPTTTATQTAFTTTLAVASSSAWYHLHVDFAVLTNANPQTITVYGKVASGTLTVQAGSACSWLP
jgi:hypothetical protein